MATSFSSNHLPFHALLEDPAKGMKNSADRTASYQRDSEKMLRPLAYLGLFGEATLCLASAVMGAGTSSGSCVAWERCKELPMQRATLLRVFGVLMDARIFRCTVSNSKEYLQRPFEI